MHNNLNSTKKTEKTHRKNYRVSHIFLPAFYFCELK